MYTLLLFGTLLNESGNRIPTVHETLVSELALRIIALGIDGNGQSVGKGLLSSMISLIAFGGDNATMSVPPNAAEWSSKLDSILLKGTTFQVIDNIVGKFGNHDLASVMTATKRHVRIKGTSDTVDVPIKLLWVFNGNNITFDSDMAQRVIMCHLEHADPTTRKQEKFHIQQKYKCRSPNFWRKTEQSTCKRAWTSFVDGPGMAHRSATP